MTRQEIYGIDNFELKHFSVYLTNLGLGIKCITLLCHQTYPSPLHVLLLCSGRGIMQCLQCFYRHLHFTRSVHYVDREESSQTVQWANFHYKFAQV